MQGLVGSEMCIRDSLVLDVRFPLLFWNLRHGLEVYGGEPTEWYYAMQRVSRITSIIGVFVLAAMSFAVH